MSKTIRRLFSSLALAALAACGGGVGELIAVLGYTGAAGGVWQRDNDHSTNTAECSGSACQITFIGGDLYSSNYTITANGDVGTGTACAAGTPGTVSGRALKVPCFSGQFRNVNEMWSDDGTIRLLFDFQPNFTSGAWYDIQHAGYRIKFAASDNATATGCELNGTQTGTVALSYTGSNISAGTFASIQSVVITRGAQTETWSAEYVGVSGLRLTRNGQVLELERRNVAEQCT